MAGTVKSQFLNKVRVDSILQYFGLFLTIFFRKPIPPSYTLIWQAIQEQDNQIEAIQLVYKFRY